MSPGRRLLALLSLAMVVDTAAYATITPLLPGLVDEYDLSRSAAGLLSGAYAIGTLAFALPAAWVASRIGPKRTVVGALALLAGASLCFGFAGSATVLVGARLLQGVGAAAIWAGVLAWVVAVAPRERRAEYLGTAVGAAIAGALGGPALGALADQLGLAVVFGAFVALPVVLIAVLVRLDGPDPQPGPGVRGLRSALAEGRVRGGMWLMTLPALCFGVLNVLGPLRLDELGAGAIAIGAIFLTAVALEALVAPAVGRVADRRGALVPARFGLATGGVVLALLPVPEAALVLALGVIVCAPLLGMLWTPAMALISEGAEVRGVDPAFGFGLSNLAWGLGAAAGGWGGGALAGVAGDATPFVVLGLASVGTAAVAR